MFISNKRSRKQGSVQREARSPPKCFLSHLQSVHDRLFEIWRILSVWLRSRQRVWHLWTTTAGRSESIFLHFYICTFLHLFVFLSPPAWPSRPSGCPLADPLAGPRTYGGLFRLSSWPLDPPIGLTDHQSGLPDHPAGLLTLQLASQTTWLPSWPSIWPLRLSNLLAGISYLLAGLSDSVASPPDSDLLCGNGKYSRRSWLKIPSVVLKVSMFQHLSALDLIWNFYIQMFLIRFPIYRLK